MRGIRPWIKVVPAIAVVAALAGIQLSHLLGNNGPQAAEYPRFTLVDQRGRTVTEADFRGRFLLVYFGYTYCPDVCPTSLSTMAGALHRLGTRAEAIQTAMITVDPDRDPPSVLGEYVDSFWPGMVGLGGSPEQVAEAARQFAVVYTRNGDGDDYTMDHSAFLYLMTPDGRLVLTIPHGTPAEALARLLAEQVP